MVATAVLIEVVAAVIQKAVELGPTVIQGVEDAKPFALALIEMLGKGKVYTQAEIDALEAKIDALSAELQEPLPD